MDGIDHKELESALGSGRVCDSQVVRNIIEEIRAEENARIGGDNRDAKCREPQVWNQWDQWNDWEQGEQWQEIIR